MSQMRYRLVQLSTSRWTMNLCGELEGMWKEPVVNGMFWGMTNTKRGNQDNRIFGPGFETKETHEYRINMRHSRFRQLMTRLSDNNEMPI